MMHHRANLAAAIARTSDFGKEVTGCGAQVNGYKLRTTCTENVEQVTCKRCLKMLAA